MGLFKKSFYSTSDIVKSDALIDLEADKEKAKKKKLGKLKLKKKTPKNYSTKAFTGSTFRKIW